MDANTVAIRMPKCQFYDEICSTYLYKKTRLKNQDYIVAGRRKACLPEDKTCQFKVFTKAGVGGKEILFFEVDKGRFWQRRKINKRGKIFNHITTNRTECGHSCSFTYEPFGTYSYHNSGLNSEKKVQFRDIQTVRAYHLH